MKLTKHHRETFGRAVMNDVPQIDYDKQAVEVVEEMLLAALPQKVRDVYADKELHNSLTFNHAWFRNSLENVCLHGGGYMSDLPVNTEPRLIALGNLKEEQSLRRDRLRDQLSGVAAACSTLKALKAALPEFEKYMPEDTGSGTGVKNLPALANLVSDFMIAGWPKDQAAS